MNVIESQCVVFHFMWLAKCIQQLKLVTAIQYIIDVKFKLLGHAQFILQDYVYPKFIYSPFCFTKLIWMRTMCVYGVCVYKVGVRKCKLITMMCTIGCTKLHTHSMHF